MRFLRQIIDDRQRLIADSKWNAGGAFARFVDLTSVCLSKCVVWVGGEWVNGWMGFLFACMLWIIRYLSHDPVWLCLEPGIPCAY